MSELGQNEGQEQEEKTPFFDSSKISDKKDVEHFANVEGAEERAKAAERAKKAAEKEAQEVHAADVRAASEQIKKTEQAESGKKGIVGFLFGGWHKIITIAVLLAIIVGIVLLVLGATKKSNENTDYKTQAKQYYDQLMETIDAGADPDGYIAARDAYAQRIDAVENEHEKFYEQYYYSLFVYYQGLNVEESWLAFDSIKIPEESTNDEICTIRNSIKLHEQNIDLSENEKYKAIIEGCHEEDQ